MTVRCLQCLASPSTGRVLILPRRSLYGDPGYPHRVHLNCPIPRSPYLTPEEHAFNQSMSQVRVSVEWIFGDIINSFKFMDLKKIRKLG